MKKVRLLIDDIEFDLIFKLIGNDILTIELERITKSNKTINLILLFKQISDCVFDFLSKNEYKRLGFLFSNGNTKWVDICQWIINKKIEGEWNLYRHPHSILIERIN